MVRFLSLWRHPPLPLWRSSPSTVPQRRTRKNCVGRLPELLLAINHASACRHPHSSPLGPSLSSFGVMPTHAFSESLSAGAGPFPKLPLTTGPRRRTRRSGVTRLAVSVELFSAVLPSLYLPPRPCRPSPKLLPLEPAPPPRSSVRIPKLLT
jgi:hypothetical protein